MINIAVVLSWLKQNSAWRLSIKVEHLLLNISLFFQELIETLIHLKLFKMEKINIEYSLKNINIPSKFQYQKILVDKTIDFIDRMRKKLFFIKNPNDGQSKNTYGFKSNWKAPPDNDMKRFEDDLIDLISNVEFNNHSSDFQRTLRNDLTQIRNEGKVIIKGDKSNNLYKQNPETYKQKLND